MWPDKTEAFRALKPPAGGAARFAERLDAIAAIGSTPERGSLPTVVGYLAVSVLAIAVVTVMWQPADEFAPSSSTASTSALPTAPAVDVYAAPEFDRLLGRPQQAKEFSLAIDDRPVTVSLLQSQDSRVRIYSITSE